MAADADLWDRFAARSSPRREVNASGERTWFNWTQYADQGPDEAVLGDVRGKVVLDLGCGSGANLAHLVTLGARESVWTSHPRGLWKLVGCGRA